MDEQQYEGITKFDDEVEMFQEYMDDVDRTIKKKYGKIGLKLWLGAKGMKVSKKTLKKVHKAMQYYYDHVLKIKITAGMEFETLETQKDLRKELGGQAGQCVGAGDPGVGCCRTQAQA